MMYDAEIRAALARNLVAADVRVVHEWAIGRSIIDVAGITPTGLHGYEIKGPRDSLARLPQQSADYSRVFDTVTLVGDSALVAQADNRSIIPEFWGLVAVVPDARGCIQFKRFRVASANPTQSTRHVAGLLYYREVRAMLQRRCVTVDRNAGKHSMIAALCDRFALDDFRPDVCRFLLARPHWKADEGRRTTGRDTKPVRPTA